MVVIDTTMLMLLFRADVPGRTTDSSGRVIDQVKDRLDYLVKTLQAAKSQIIIPTPVLSELLVRADAADVSRIVDSVNRLAVFRVVPFDTIAAIELAAISRNALAAGDKKASLSASWAKVKFDRQIVAIARVARASVVYTDDENLASTARRLNMQTFGIADLPLPPETAQGKLPFEDKSPDPIDEVARQTQSTHEPESPDEQGPGQQGG